MRRALLSTLLLAVIGCGSDKLDPAFAGLWKGAATLTIGGSSVTDDTVQVSISLPSETSITIAPVCPENAGSITATGKGDSVSWTGTTTCPAAAVGSCASVVVTLQSGTASLSSNLTTLSASAAGTATGCSQTNPFGWQFVGTK